MCPPHMGLHVCTRTHSRESRDAWPVPGVGRDKLGNGDPVSTFPRECEDPPAGTGRCPTPPVGQGTNRKKGADPISPKIFMSHELPLLFEVLGIGLGGEPACPSFPGKSLLCGVMGKSWAPASDAISLDPVLSLSGLQSGVSHLMPPPPPTLVFSSVKRRQHSCLQ